MKRRMYAVYDVKAECPVGVIQMLATDSEAVRSFTGIVKAEGTLLSEHPEDFVFCFLGTIDFNDLSIDPNANALLKPVCRGIDIARALSRVRDSDSVPA